MKWAWCRCLTREGEIELAKRIERGERAVRKALSRSRLTVHFHSLTPSTPVEKNHLSIMDVMQAPDVQLGQEEEDAGDALREQFFAAILEIEKIYKKSQQTEQKLIAVSRNMKPKQYRKLRFEYARQMVLISRAIRCIAFSIVFAAP